MTYFVGITAGSDSLTQSQPPITLNQARSLMIIQGIMSDKIPNNVIESALSWALRLFGSIFTILGILGPTKWVRECVPQ